MAPGAAVAESTECTAGSLRNRRTSTSTALSRVAENSIRWPSGGVASSSRRTTGRKPRSAMWSASSSTLISTSPRWQCPCSMRSASRPGQATTMSTRSTQRRYLGVLPGAAEDGGHGQAHGPGQRQRSRRGPGWPAPGWAPGPGRAGGPRWCDRRPARRPAGSRTRASCRNRSGRGPGCPARPAHPAAWRPGSGTGR